MFSFDYTGFFKHGPQGPANTCVHAIYLGSLYSFWHPTALILLCIGLTLIQFGFSSVQLLILYPLTCFIYLLMPTWGFALKVSFHLAHLFIPFCCPHMEVHSKFTHTYLSLLSSPVTLSWSLIPYFSCPIPLLIISSASGHLWDLATLSHPSVVDLAFSLLPFQAQALYQHIIRAWHSFVKDVLSCDSWNIGCSADVLSTLL